MNTILMRGAVAAGFVLGAGCASASNTAVSRQAKCALEAADSVFLARGPVYRDCAVDAKAQIVGNRASPQRPATPPVPRAGTNCYSAEVAFVVDTLGHPEAQSIRLVRTNDQDYAKSVLEVIPQWRYQPARLGNAPVRQIVQEKSALGSITVVAPAGQRPPTPTRGPRC